MQDKPSEWAMRAAERIHEATWQHVEKLHFWGDHEEITIEDIACIIDEAYLKWCEALRKRDQV